MYQGIYTYLRDAMEGQPTNQSTSRTESQSSSTLPHRKKLTAFETNVGRNCTERFSATPRETKAKEPFESFVSVDDPFCDSVNRIRFTNIADSTQFRSPSRYPGSSETLSSVMDNQGAVHSSESESGLRPKDVTSRPGLHDI